MIMMLDDYHNIHVKKVPQKLQTSTAVHMASSILDIHVGNSEKNYWAIAGKTAEYLLNLFKEVAANTDKSREVKPTFLYT